MRTFHLYIAKGFPPCARRPERKHPNFGHFLPIWGISWPLTSYLKSFLSVSLDLAYRSNETFCSRTHRFGCGPETLVGWKGWKVHRNGGYPAAHFEFCRSSVTPSGPPSALTSSCSDGPVAVVFVVVVVVLVVDVVACVIDVVWPFWSLLLVCLLLSLFHGQIIRASTRICDPSYFKRLHLWALIILQSSRVTETPPSTRFYCPPHLYYFEKWGFYTWKGNI